MTVLTSREIVKRCIEFRDPPRIGWHFDVMPAQGQVWPVTDFGFASYAPDPNVIPRKPGADEWGVVKVSLDPSLQGIGEAKDCPLAEGWHLLETYPFPDFTNPARYANLERQVAELHAQGKYVYGDIPSLMLLPSDLRGMENWFADQLLEQDSLCWLLDRIVEMRLAIIDQFARAGMDGAITWDDMGTNERVFVQPALYRKLYLPRYKKTAEYLHERKMHLIHHCCGMVRQYMDLFIEGGCDVLQLDQPECMGIDWLSQQYGGKICFWNSVDIQKTLPTLDAAAIEREAHRQAWKLGNFEGGFMVKAYQQPESIGITAAASQAQFDAFTRLASYPLIPYKDRE